MKLLGLTDEQQLAIEETTGIKTEGVKLLFEAANQQAQQIAQALVKESIKEVQSVVGPHGSVTRLQAGGVNISPGLGVGVFESGVLKTIIEPDGDLLVGSDITQPSTTSFCVFVNEQMYNSETMGAGDMLIGDNSTGASNVKYDASEGQLQFRLGTTVNVYMDTDGSLKAGGGAVTLNENGIQIVPLVTEDSVRAYKFRDGTIEYGGVYGVWDPAEENHISIWVRGDNSNSSAGFSVVTRAPTGNTSTIAFQAIVNNVIKAGLTMSETGCVVNDAGEDSDTRIEGDTDANLVFVDASTNRVGIGTATPGYKLDVNGDVNVPSGSTYKVNGATVVSGTVTGVTNGDSHNHVGGDGGQISYLDLSNLPTAETNANNIYACASPGGVSLWTGTISGTPSGASVTVSAPTSGTEGVLVPSSTSQLAKLRIYNTTRGNSALLSDYNTGTNVMTLTANAPADWANGDSLTTVSTTVSGGGFNWMDLEITSGPTGESSLQILELIISATPGDTLRVHPLESYSASKAVPIPAQVANIQAVVTPIIKITSNVFCISWTGTPTTIILRELAHL